ncbi:cyclophilin-like fold protein [Sulfurimonas sp.]|uniref:cyclophilin-like fold protein n=1 Tax=Sulfurimonas sp. TaxID=2022749 RepID=UPI003567E786
MKISIESNGEVTIFELNNSNASKDLLAQLPMNIEVENYSHNEKIFYPPKKLSTSNTPMANAKNGTLAYYAPWGDVVMFYKDFGSVSGLYELGRCIENCENIKNMSGIIEIKVLKK